MSNPDLTLYAENAGHLAVSCPAKPCQYQKLFRETRQTRSDPNGSKARREEYLRQQHNAGMHGVPDSPYA